MESTLLFLAACLMFSGVQGDSESMSCSTVNGKMICDRQAGSGNTAMSSSQSSTGFGQPDYQRTYAGTGGQNQWDSSSQTVRGGSPGGYNNRGDSNTRGPSGQSGSSSSSYSYSSSSNSGDAGPQGGGGAFAGGFAVAGPLPFFSGSGYPPRASSSQSGGAPDQGPGYVPVMPIAAGPMAFVNQFMGGGGFGGGAFAGAGAFPFGRR